MPEITFPTFKPHSDQTRQEYKVNAPQYRHKANKPCREVHQSNKMPFFTIKQLQRQESK